MPLDNKISNVLGAAMPEWLKGQLKTRSEQNSQDVRDDSNLLYLANKTAWVRLISSVNINGENKVGTPLADLDWFNRNLGTTLKNSEDLAKNYILYGGTSKYLKTTNDKSFKYELRSGVEKDGAYGMLGEQEVSQYGYRPMPGITDVRIETQGKLGSVRMATINFKAWDKMQLDIMDTLYFKLGYTMLLEWANTVYYKTSKSATGDSKPILTYTEFDAIDPFLPGTTKEKIQLQISQNVRKTEGNYDAMLGIVTNFNFSFNQEGGYDCSVKIIALGALGDSIKVNNPTNLPEVLKPELKKYVEILNKFEADKKAKEEQDAAAKQAALDIQNLQSASDAKKAGLVSYEDELVRLSNNIDNKLYESDLPTTDFDLKKKNDASYVRAASKNTNLYLNDINTDVKFYFDGDGIAFAKTKQFIDIETRDKVENTEVVVDLSYLDSKIYGVSNAARQIPNALGNYTDLLVYNASYDINNITDYYNRNPAQFNTLTTSSLGYGDNGKGFESSGIGSATATIGESGKYSSITNHIQYAYSDTVYRVELTIPDIANGQSGAPTMKFKDPAINSKESNYQYHKVRDKIIEAISNGTSWKVSTEYCYNAKPNSGATINYNYGIFKDDLRNSEGFSPAANNRRTLGFMLYKDVKFQIDGKVSTTTNVRGRNVVTEVAKKLNYSFKIGLMITDASSIKSIIQKGSETLDTENALLQEQIAAVNNRNKPQPAYADQKTIDAQVNAALKLQSNLELSLKAIQLYGLNKVIPSISVDSLTGLNKVVKLNMSNTPQLREFYKSIFKYGIYKTFLLDLIDKKIQEPTLNGKTGEDWVNTYKDLDTIIKLKIAAKYGFSSAILGGHESPDEIKEVDYNDLMSIYVVPYDPNKSIDGGVKILYSTYVQLGMVFMILNDMCTIYDTTKGPNNNTQSTPLVYIDYNPETNTCLSLPQQFTTNAFDFLIPFQSTDSDYEAIFPEGTYDKTNNVLQGDKPESLFRKSVNDRVSADLPNFRTLDTATGAYSGKTMKVLVGIDYVLDLVKEFAQQDGTNSVYLKPLLERLLKDMNNYLGNVNIFRLAYTDSSNTYSIVDDQFQPLLPNQQYVKSNSTTDEIPVFGKKSIAKSINIQTEISSKLSNMLAISSNSNPKDQASLSTNATSFGFINNSYSDRYITNKGGQTNVTVSASETVKSSLRAAAQRFNRTIKSYYSIDKDNTPSKDNVYQATNFYISQISEQMAKDSATRASAMIPVSVTFATDGISGFYMGQAFTLPPQMLPYTYTQRVTQDLSKDQNKVAFATVGVTHEISNNVWQTTIKGSMILIKDENNFAGSMLSADSAPTNIQQTSTERSNLSGPIIDQILNFVKGGEGLASTIKLDTSIKRGPTGKAYAYNNTDPNLILYPYNLEGNIVDGLPGLTIGWGTYLTYRAGPKKGQRILAGDTITAKEADDNLKAELLPLYNAVMAESKNKNVTLKNGQIIALVDLGYNAGLGGMKQSPLWKNAFDNIPILAADFRRYRVPAAFIDSLGRRRQEQLNEYNT